MAPPSGHSKWRTLKSAKAKEMDSQTIQTIAAVIQASAAILFFWSVNRERRLKEQDRRDRVIAGLRGMWVQIYVNPAHAAMTHEELAGFYSPRQIEFFNKKLEELGETWRYPFKRL
jgi:hypothetical protein